MLRLTKMINSRQLSFFLYNLFMVLEKTTTLIYCYFIIITIIMNNYSFTKSLYSVSLPLLFVTRSCNKVEFLK
jgi:hypothetical protein